MAASTDYGENAEADDYDEALGQGLILEEFKERKEVDQLIDSLKDVYQNENALELTLERYTFIVDKYQEQPHLIDPHLESLVLKLVTKLRDLESPPQLRNQIARCLYLITKMRGYKIVVRYFPHEVSDVEPVLELIGMQSPKDHSNWETRYCLLLWLSMVCMIPFDLRRLDSSAVQDGVTKKPVMDRIMEIAETYLTVTDKVRDASAYLMAKFVTRPDVKSVKLAEFLDWTIKVIRQADMDTMSGMSQLCGCMSALSLLFKHGKREDLLEHAPTMLRHLLEFQFMQNDNSLLRKAYMKVIQRLGLIFLPPRVAKWRYQRGCRSLAENLKRPFDPKESSKTNVVEQDMEEEEEDDEFDVPSSIEDIIEQLLQGLKDKDTVVRWSAAKGVGRVTGRLPKELADEVVGSLLELFSLQETDGAWHGGCLALAELGRRGLLLPSRLPDVVPVIMKSLLYDEWRGNYSVGAHVRDAACYVCWSFARAYDPQKIAPFVPDIARGLVITAIFDREVNVRRAASAAFQENVGRQGTLPHGIEILTAADYHSVGKRPFCFLNLSVFVAGFEEYTQALIDHLVKVKLSHWDNTIRDLSARALHSLTPKMPDYLAKTVLPGLVPSASGLDLYLRHGATLAIAHVTHALALIAAERNKPVTDEFINASTVAGMKDIVKKLSDMKRFRGHGGELMRKAVCIFIEKLSLSKLPFHQDPVLELWQSLLDDSLHHIEEDVRTAAVAAIPAFFSQYYQSGGGVLEKQEEIITQYLKELKNPVETSRMGYALALGACPKFMLSGRMERVLEGLVSASQIGPDCPERCAESRRDAIKAITRASITMGVDGSGGDPALTQADLTAVYEAFLAAMKDYTLDSRGDVGACVREAAMSGIQEVTSMVVKTGPSLLKPDIVERLFCNLAQQACEKIDRTRRLAGNVFMHLLHHQPKVPHVPHEAELLKIFPLEEIRDVNWAAPVLSFPRFTELLALPAFTYHVLLGLLVSVGGLTESVVKHSTSSLSSYLRRLNQDQIVNFASILVRIFTEYQKVDRVTLPLLKTLTMILCDDLFGKLRDVEGCTVGMDLYQLTKTELHRCSDPQKVMAGADVYCGLLQFDKSVQRKVLMNITVLLCHRFPKVRMTTANKLYEAILTYEGAAPDESLDEILTLLTETLWDRDIGACRQARDTLCDLFQIPKPILKARVEKQPE